MQLITPLIFSLLLARFVVGQYSQSSNMGGMDSGSPSMMISPTGTSSAASPSGSIPVHVIKVSDKNGTLAYSPSSKAVPVGEMVQWHFYPMNHSVVQAAFNDPCQPISKTMPNMTTFYTGYMPVGKTDMMLPVMSMKISSKQPFWYYCSQGKHCQNGMVGVINPPDPSTGKTVEAFAKKAMTAPPSTIPMNGTVNGTTNAGTSQTAAAPAPSNSKFAGAANNLVAMGLTTFAGIAIACFM